MSKIVLDADLRAKLNGLSEQVELCDAAGATVGRFVPEAIYKHLLSGTAERACPYSPDELERLQREEGVSTLAEFWQRMQKQ